VNKVTVDSGLGQGASLWRVAAGAPGTPALVDPNGDELSFAELAELANRAANALRDLELGQGDAVAAYLPNGTSMVVLALATGQIGVHFVPVNWHLTGAEAHYVVTDSGADVVVVGDPEHASAMRSAGPLPAHRFVDTGPPPAGWRSWAAPVAAASPQLPARRSAGETMGYTSGTTGRPKGVRRHLTGRPPEESLAGLLATAHALGIRGGTGAHLVCSPLYHAAPLGFTLASLHLGHAVVVRRRFDPDLVLRDVERHRITETHMVPTHFHRLLQLPRAARAKADLRSLRAVLHAGAPCPVHVKRAMIDWVGPVLYEYLAATEGAVSLVDSEAWLRHPGTVGRPFPGVRVELLDDDGTPVPAGEAGTIYFSMPDWTFEYHNDPAKTAASRHGDLCTVGDIGRWDEEGYLYVLDRRSDLVVSGGVNVYPAEVEGQLLAHPAVADVVVFGVPDEAWGASVVAVVSPVGGDTSGENLRAELFAHCERTLAGFKRPKRIEFGPVPRTSTGKVLRGRARAEFLGGAAGESRWQR
jgi:long-chain acyl-CoA synthetase